MNIFQQVAKLNRPAFIKLRREFQAEQRLLTREFIEVPEEQLAELHADPAKRPVSAWKSRDYLVQLFIDTVDACTPDEEQFLRLSIARCVLTNDGGWQDGMTWDDLMEVKRGIGFATFWAVEVFPPDEQIVDVASMRHLFITKQPAFAWVKKEEA